MKGDKKLWRARKQQKTKEKEYNQHSAQKKIKSFKKFLPVKPSVSPSETKSFAGRNFFETVLILQLLVATL